MQRKQLRTNATLFVLVASLSWLDPGMGGAAEKPRPKPPKPATPAKPAKQPNVLFIAVDDLNDWVGCLGGQGLVCGDHNGFRLPSNSRRNDVIFDKDLFQPECQPLR